MYFILSLAIQTVSVKSYVEHFFASYVDHIVYLYICNNLVYVTIYIYLINIKKFSKLKKSIYRCIDFIL